MHRVVLSDEDFSERVTMPIMNAFKNAGCAATGLTKPYWIRTEEGRKVLITDAIGCTCEAP